MSPNSLDFDHVELLIGSVESAEEANAKAVKSTVLTPDPIKSSTCARPMGRDDERIRRRQQP